MKKWYAFCCALSIVSAVQAGYSNDNEFVTIVEMVDNSQDTMDQDSRIEACLNFVNDTIAELEKAKDKLEAITILMQQIEAIDIQVSVLSNELDTITQEDMDNNPEEVLEYITVLNQQLQDAHCHLAILNRLLNEYDPAQDNADS